ncbi:MAG: hypothetical protein EBT68_08635, partial [Verrucomicrobia bacterium]|nr:hypothetical protein [Verrucomicrobiota bacterium]
LGNDGSLANRVITVNGSHTIAAAITGGNNNHIVQQGGGTLTLSGANTFSGGIFIDNGTMIFSAGSDGGGAGAALALGAQSGGSDNATFTMGGNSLSTARNVDIRAGSGTRTLNFNNSSGTTNTITGTLSHAKGLAINVANSGGTALLSGVISGSGGNVLSVTGNGTLAVNNSGNTTDARWSIGSGATLAIGDSRNLGAVPGGFYSDKFTFAGGTLRATNSFDFGTNNGITIGASGGTIQVDAGNTLTVREYISDGSATGVSFFKTGAGTLFLNKSGSLDFSGTTLKVSEGVLDTWNPNGNLSSTVELGGATTSGTYKFTKSDGGVSTDRSFVANAGGGRIQVTDNDLTVTGTLGGSGTFTKEGAGRLILSGANTNTGGVTLSAGQLRLGSTTAAGT